MTQYIAGPVIVERHRRSWPGPPIGGVEDLTAGARRARSSRSSPELVLLGTGARQIFPAAVFGAQFLRAGIGFEVMDTGAACRTFNVLVAEQRRVVGVAAGVSFRMRKKMAGRYDHE